MHYLVDGIYLRVKPRTMLPGFCVEARLDAFPLDPVVNLMMGDLWFEFADDQQGLPDAMDRLLAEVKASPEFKRGRSET